MKKLFTLLMLCGFIVAVSSCGGSAKQEEVVDSTAVEEVEAPVEEMEVEADTAASAETDTTESASEEVETAAEGV
ncbi:MAG: hypothetical protein HC842_03535 [Cytophagales bacterium]|nr:hypothetical protein [Cytophagales bacterium]